MGVIPYKMTFESNSLSVYSYGSMLAIASTLSESVARGSGRA